MMLLAGSDGSGHHRLMALNKSVLSGLLAIMVLAVSCAPVHQKLATTTGNASPSVVWPGHKADGSVLLPNQWSLRPVGRQLELGDFPVNIALHPGGQFAAILHCGYGAHEIIVVDVRETAIASRTRIAEGFYGLEFDRTGDTLYCSGSSDELIYAFDFMAGSLSGERRFPLRNAREKGVPAGLAVDNTRHRLYAANVWGHRVSRVDLTSAAQVFDIPLGAPRELEKVAVRPEQDFDTAAAEKRREAAAMQVQAEDTFPYGCRVDEKRQRLYVSLWAQAAVAVIDLKSNRVIAYLKTEEHPCEMVLSRSGKHLFVANASRNTVSVFETDSGRLLETLWAALYPQSPPGSTPNSLALTPDETLLFVANADNNMLAVFDVRKPGRSRSIGFIPTGWYPTSVRVTPDGQRLLVANGKGFASKPNPNGPKPGLKSPQASTREYIGGLFKGGLTVIDLHPLKDFYAKLAGYTAQARQCSPLRPDASTWGERAADNPIPRRPGDSSPIKYCLYIIKENRTYDQVLGDLPEGNGDPTLCLFPEQVTPNHHQLARDFVLLDNFYVESEVSADGHEWSMAAYATDFVEKTWPLKYGHGRSEKFPYPSEGNLPVAAPAGGYLWDRAKEAGITYRSYGEFVNNGTTPSQPARSKVKNLVGHIDEWFRGFDMAYSDFKRADRFISELKRFEAEGDMPRLQILRLPNDHTHGASRGFPTPTAYLAENDAALGMIIEAVSRSRFWSQTAVFVVEDDAQNGSDHVDAHRTIAYAISPYIRRGLVDSTLYSTASMLRTMELILGLQPMSQFDAAARPMYNAFQATPDLRPYTARPANVSTTTQNAASAWGGDIKMNFAKEDAADDLLLNEIVWRSVRGADSPMPRPVRAAFVFPHQPGRDDDDD